MFRKTLAALGVAAALTLIPTTAHALDCTNMSRPTNTVGAKEVPLFDMTAYVKGNWVLLPFPGATWVFVPPGTLKEVPVDLTPAGASGNFQSGEGYALLVNAICDSRGAVLDNRQSTRGIQLMEGCVAAPH